MKILDLIGTSVKNVFSFLGEGILLLQPGKHEFPFSFQLPSE